MSEFPFEAGQKITRDGWPRESWIEIAAVRGTDWIGWDHLGHACSSRQLSSMNGWQLWVPPPETRQWIITTEYRETTPLSMFVDVINGRPDLRHFIDPRTLVVDSVGAAGKLADVVVSVVPYASNPQPEPDGKRYTLRLSCGCVQRVDCKYSVGSDIHCDDHCTNDLNRCQIVDQVAAEPFLNATQETPK